MEKKNGTTVHTTKYYYDGTKLAAENKDGTIVWYDYDENGVPIGMRVNGQDYIFRRNLQGDIVKIFNSDNDPVVGYNYQNAWGGGVEVTGPLGGSIGKYNSLRYRGITTTANSASITSTPDTMTPPCAGLLMPIRS